MYPINNRPIINHSSSPRALVFAAACVGMCFFGVTMVALGSLLPSLAASLHLSPSEQTLLATAESIGIFIGSLIFGPLCDRHGHKWLLVSACALVALGLGALTITSLMPLLVAAISAVGIGGGILNGQTNALVADIYTGPEGSSRLSLLGMFYGIGAITITSLLWALEAYDFTIVTRGIVIVMLAATAFCAAIRYPQPKVSQSFPIAQALRMLTRPAMLILSLVLFCESGIEMATNTWATTYFGKLSLARPQTLLLTLTVMVAALTLARAILSIALARFNSPAVLLTCIAILAAGFITMSVASTISLAFIAMILIGFGTAATFPVVLARIGQLFPALTGTAFGIAITIALVGNIAVNAIAGSVVGSSNIATFPYIMLAFTAAMAALWLFAQKIHK